MKLKSSVLFFSLLVAGSAFAQGRKETPAPKYKIASNQKINASLYQLAFNTANDQIYVVGPKGGFKAESDQYVYVLSGQNLAVVDSINIGKNTPFGLAINNTTQTLYVGHSLQQSISAIDLKTKKQRLIPSGREKSKIREIAVDEKNNMVYVSDHGDPSIWVVDGATNTYKKTITAPGTSLLGLNVDQQRGRLYSSDSQTMEGNILVYDTKDHKLVGKWKTWSYCPLNIAVDKSNNRLFVSQSNDNNITVLDGKTGNIINKIYLGYDASPIGLVYDSKNDLVYVANRNKKEVAIVNMKDYQVIERVATKGLPNTLVINEKDGSVYVTNKSPRKAEEGLENGDTVQKITKI